MSMARSEYNPAFPAYWTPKMIDEARAVWGAQSAKIKDELAATWDAQKRSDESLKQIEEEKVDALAWCRDNGNPHQAEGMC